MPELERRGGGWRGGGGGEGLGWGRGKEREFLVSLLESILVLPIIWLLNNFLVVMDKINSLKKKPTSSSFRAFIADKRSTNTALKFFQ